MNPISVSFNGYTLQNASFRTRIIQHTNTPDRTIQMESRARADGMSIVNVKYNYREIEIEGILVAADRASLVSVIDTMKKNLDAVSGTLLVDYGNDQRRYFATAQKIEMPEDFYNLSTIPYKVSFVCADPFGYTTASGMVNLSLSNLLNQFVLTTSGNYNSDPSFIITFIATTSGILTVGVSNNTTGENMVISRYGGYIITGDEIIINSKTKQVFLNASGVDYTGKFPTLVPGDNNLQVALAGVSANYTIVCQYSPTFT